MRGAVHLRREPHAEGVGRGQTSGYLQGSSPRLTLGEYLGNSHLDVWLTVFTSRWICKTAGQGPSAARHWRKFSGVFPVARCAAEPQRSRAIVHS